MKRFTLISLIAIPSLLSSLVACHKDNGGKPPSLPTDTLTQNVYTINAQGPSSPALILASPLSQLGPSTTFSPGLLLVMDENGQVLKKKITNGSAFDFDRWVLDGQTRYTWIESDNNAFLAPGATNFSGFAVIADTNLNEIKRINFIPYGPGPYQTNQELDVHDFILLSDNHYITESWYRKFVTNIPARLNPSPKVAVLAPIIQEVNNGAVVWQWDGSLDTAFYASSVEGNHFSDSTVTQDYMHLNSLFIDPRDNNLICSFRNQDQVIKISRQTGQVLWRLGGNNSDFHLFSDQVFLRQHHATLVDDNQTLLIFDDGEATQRPESRIVEFKLDETNKKILSFKSFTIPEPFTPVMGSVQKFGDEYFIGGGSADYMLEVNSITGQLIREYKGSQPTYRAFRVSLQNP